MTQDDTEPVLHRLLFGERARQHREAAGIEFGDADTRLGGYAGKLSKIENGIIGPKPTDVEAMITLYGLTSEDADELRELGAAARSRSAPERVSGTFRQYVQLERAATEIRMVYNHIPGLLQTKDFALAGLARSTTVSAGDTYALAEARAQRSAQMMRPDGANMWIVLGMDALYRELGGPAVLRAQLHRLREIAALPNVWLRVLPWSAGAVSALDCPFTLLYIKPNRTVAYVESLTRADYIKTTGPYRAAFDQAWQFATLEAESIGMIGQRITELSRRSERDASQ